MPKPRLRIQTTTLWDYPSQNYGKDGLQGDQQYVGATPSYVIWNLLMRYTKPGDLVVDPMVGSGTTIDVSRDLERRAIGYDIAPFRDDIIRADARALPLEREKADFVFVDPPYGDNVKYSDEEGCIGALPATDPAYFDAMAEVIQEIYRVLKPEKYLGLYVCDYYNKKKGFVPIGFYLYQMLLGFFMPIEQIAVVRHNRTLQLGNYHKSAEEGNFFLRGFNHLFIMQKERSAPQARSSRRRR